MSTFTPNLGLENPPYLGANNAWGTIENTARTQVDLSISGQAKFTLTGPTFTISVSNGLVTQSTSRVWIFNGTPGAPVTITFAPNTAQNWVFVVNNTAQPLTFTQGTGTTVTVIALGSNVLVFDGGGAAANVTEFPTIPNQPPGSVSNPSYSFAGFPDVGLFVPGASTLAIAAGGLAMAKFQSAVPGPGGLNSLGSNMVGNALSSNLDMFAGAWTGPAVTPGYSYLYLNETTGQAFLKYLDIATSTQRVILLGNYLPANTATYVGSAPIPIPPAVTIPNSTAYYLANETTFELDLYFKDSHGTLFGPFGREYYQPTNQSVFIGAAPTAALANQYSYFQINEPIQELDWYYRGSGGTLHGPIPIATYQPAAAGAGPLASYVGAAPQTLNIQQQYFTVNETTGELDWWYLDSHGHLWGPSVVSNYNATSGWVNTYVPTLTSSSGWTVIGPGPGSAGQCMYQKTNKTCAIQMLFEVTSNSTGAGTATVSLPVPTVPTSGGGFSQSLSVSQTSPLQWFFSHILVYGTTMTFDYTAPLANPLTFYVQINGVYQTA